MLRPLYLFIFKILGWKIRGAMPNVPKYVVAVAPHTSNWDFPLGVAARSILRMQSAQFLGKSQLFVPPIGWFFRWLGGHPVKRTTKEDMVEQVVDIFNRHTHFILALAPEGTRKKVEKLRTGFYYIAKGAHVPIVPVGFDYGHREVVVGDPMYPTDFEMDMSKLMTFYRQMKGKNPDQGL